MERTPAIHAVFCGKIADTELFKSVLAPFFELFQEGVVASLVLSTWEGEVDRHPGLALFLAVNGVQVIESRLPDQLKVEGNVFEQVFTLDRALDTLDEDDLVLRTRGDVLFDCTDALRELLLQDLPVIDPALPPAFRRRVWVAAFHPSIPWFLRDQIFYGTVGDLQKLGGYDLLVEAYGVKSRPHEVVPHHSTGGAPEVRRFMAPFLPHFPILREYQFVWPKLCIGTGIFQEVLAFNEKAEVYREHLAFFLYVMHHYFKVGADEDSALNENVMLIGSDDKGFFLRYTLCFSEMTWAKATGSERRRKQLDEFMTPQGMYPAVSVEAGWLQELMEDKDDPQVQGCLHEPLRRAMDYRHGPQRNQVLERYLLDLYQLADAA